MKAGKRRNSSSIDSVQQSAESTDAVAAVTEEEEEESRRDSADSENLEGEEEDSEAEQLEDVQIEEDADGERPKLADGFYEIEAVRRKRVRKGKVQYLIKWRDWSEAANTWEPIENLLQCSDVIEAFEESLKAGKGRPSRKRKRKVGVTHAQTKKKQHHQQRSPAATYNVPSHVIRIAEEPITFPRMNDVSTTIERGETSISRGRASKKVYENGARTFSVTREGEKEQSELDLKLCDLKGALASSTRHDDRYATTTLKGQFTNGLQGGDGVDPGQLGRCTGAKRRKSGSVKRFKKDAVSSCSPDDYANGGSACASLVPINVQHVDFLGNYVNYKSKFDDSRNMCTLTQIVRPISYKASVSNNVQEVLLTFEALRSDGSKVTVDNKFLKANNPLLLIDYYEKHLRYSPT
ncbi:chromo domain protein LHP1-like [Andrographis paniculata]|uniref:chromo domain protein LHP1-like n=1 Tax=Andrographis paniculata TaxID=175694 RepID=UPI0021E7AC62|nr:chromo domain protein LHP1-like [Andrographis paniculata]